MSWTPLTEPPAFAPEALTQAVSRIREPLHLVRDEQGVLGVAFGGRVAPEPGPFEHVGTLPPLYPEWLGDRRFAETHGLRFPYVAGEMANGIATAELVIAMARAGMLGFFGAAGLSLERVNEGLDTLER